MIHRSACFLIAVVGASLFSAGPRAGAQDAPAPDPEISAWTGRLSSPSATGRRDACAAFGASWPGSAAAVPALLEVASDDESPEVRAAAASALGAVARSGAAEFAAAVRGVDAARLGAGLKLVFMLGPAATPMDFAPSIRSEAEGPGALLAFAFRNNWFPHRIVRGEESEAALQLRSPNPRIRSAARAGLAAAAAVGAVAAGGPRFTDGPWVETADWCLSVGSEAHDWLGVRMFASIATAGPKSQVALVDLAVESSSARSAGCADAIASAGIVPEARRNDLIDALGLGVLRIHAKAGLTADIVSRWGAAPGVPAARGTSRELAAIADFMREPRGAVAAYMRRLSDASPADADTAWEHGVVHAALAAKGGDLTPALTGRPELAAAAAGAILETQPDSEPARSLLAKGAVSPGFDGQRSLEVLATLPSVSVGLDAKALGVVVQGSRSTVSQALAAFLLSRDRTTAAGAAPCLHAAADRITSEFRAHAGASVGAGVDPFGLDVVDLGNGYVGLAEIVRTLGHAGDAARDALPLARQLATARDARLAHIARTAIRRIAPDDPVLLTPSEWSGPLPLTTEQRARIRRRR